MPQIFTIPPHRSFADALVGGLIARGGGDRMALARGIVLVPSARAARAVTDAFVRAAEGGLLLPRIVTLGEVEAETPNAALDPAGADPVPPAIDAMLRRMVLARLVGEARPGTGAAEAVRLATDLARVIDQMALEEVAPRALRDLSLAPELAAHWQTALTQLSVVLDRWPEELARLGRIDAAERRNLLLDRLAKAWMAEPPAGFVCAAGITVASPAAARLLKAVAGLDRGMVVLPFLDRAMPDAEWASLGPHDPDPVTGRRRRAVETHPQFHLKLLLDRMGVARGEVETWRGSGGAKAPATRTRAIADAMAPADYTVKWQGLKGKLPGVRALELAGPAEEAQAIALMLRGALEVPGRTAALVTPDRALAARVSAHLERWDIAADDSAGVPLSQKAAGTLLAALAGAAAERFAPVALMTLLKHPLVAAGKGRAAWLAGARALDRHLRGPRPAAGLAGVTGHVAEERVADWWAGVAATLSPLEQAFSHEQTPPVMLIAALREAATALAGDAAWAGPAGRAAAELIEALETAAPAGPAMMAPEELPALLGQLMGEMAVRPPQGGHPRVFIWGLIEARLAQADLMVLGGLNEGVWPASPAPDPWLSPRIRAELGLPTLERRIGVEAHEFALALGAPRVLMTRARRDARSPTIASRFWLRLEAMTGGVARVAGVRAWAAAIDRPAAFAPAERPAPAPPADARPRRLSVTSLDRLQADPYAFYAASILRLSALDALDADPSPAWRGTMVHDVLEAWMTEDDCAPEKLRARAEALLEETAAHPVLRAMWAPRLMEAIDWIAGETAKRVAEGRRPWKGEITGETEVAGVVVHGRVDRIDRDDSGEGAGGLTIIDYKTGQPPSATAVAAGFAMQLGLLGLIAERDGFAGVRGTPTAFEYWSLAAKGGGLGFVATPVGTRAGQIAAEDFTGQAARVLQGAVERWLTGDAPFTAKLHPEHAPYGDYDQLMRLDEWYGRTG